MNDRKLTPVSKGAVVVPCEIRKEIQRIIECALKLLLANYDCAKVNIIMGDNTTIYEIDVKQSDFGRLLGSRGRNIDALRTIVGSLAATKGIRAIVNVKDEDRFF